jgi:hypothetical protein
VNTANFNFYSVTTYKPSELASAPQTTRWRAESAQETIKGVEDTVDFFIARDNEKGIDKNPETGSVTLEDAKAFDGSGDRYSGTLDKDFTLKAEVPEMLGGEYFARSTDEQGNTYHATGRFDAGWERGGRNGIVNVVKTDRRGNVTIMSGSGNDSISATGSNFLEALFSPK